MKTITWNVNKASCKKTNLWKTLLDEDPDVVMLQEVTSIPDWITNDYNCHSVTPMYFETGKAPFRTVILSKWRIDTTPFLYSDIDWINKIHAEQYGWITECETVNEVGVSFRIVAVHLPAFSIPKKQLQGVDVKEIKLKAAVDVWFTEILWSLLQNAHAGDATNWIIGGDFNSSLGLDFPKDRGNHEFVERLNSIGLTDCLSYHRACSVPTFQNAKDKRVIHQLDYCYVNAPLLERLNRAQVMTQERVFGAMPKLSDHLPVICEFSS